jgi:Arc/MetJ-type ribon-helix-helix transcriptional regulator
MNEELEAVSLRLPKSLLKRIDDIRKRSVFFPSKTAIIRRLLEKALALESIEADSQSKQP